MPSLLGKVKLSRESEETPDLEGASVGFPGTGQPEVALSPAPVPDPSVYPGCAEADPNVPQVMNTVIKGVTAGGVNHAFTFQDPRAILSIDSVLRTQRMSNRYALEFRATLQDTSGVVNVGPLNLLCRTHPEGCP